MQPHFRGSVVKRNTRVLRYEPERLSARFWLLVAAGLLICVKLPQEYWIHVAQLDFTDTVRDYPAFGAAVLQIVVGVTAIVLANAAISLAAPRGGGPARAAARTASRSSPRWPACRRSGCRTASPRRSRSPTASRALLAGPPRWFGQRPASAWAKPTSLRYGESNRALGIGSRAQCWQ